MLPGRQPQLLEFSMGCINAVQKVWKIMENLAGVAEVGAVSSCVSGYLRFLDLTTWRNPRWPGLLHARPTLLSPPTPQLFVLSCHFVVQEMLPAATV